MFGAASTALEDLPGVIQAIRSQLKPGKLFGVNLFTPPQQIPEPTQQQQQALEEVHAYYEDLKVKHSLDCVVQLRPLPAVEQLMSSFEAQVQMLLDHKVPIISFYFGLPEPQLLSRIKAAGVYTVGTATCLQEAQYLEAAGISCIVAQGSEAGGHRGTHYDTGDYRPHMVGTLTLVELLAQHIKHTPVLAAGGIMTGRQIVAAIAAGAAGVQLGTAFLTCREAGTSSAGKQLLLQDHSRGTTVSQAWTGRPARGLTSRVTRELQQLQEQLPLSLIGVVHARPFHAAVAAAGVSDLVMQLCGQGYPLCRECSAGQLMQELVKEADEAFEQ